MRDFVDLFVRGAACVPFGVKLGFSRVCFGEVAYCEPFRPGQARMVGGKVNVVRGGPVNVNQEAVSLRAQVLLDPVSERERGFDSAICQVASDNGVAVGFSLASILEKNFASRARLLRNYSFAAQLCKKYGVEVVIVSGAKNAYGMRAPQDLAAIGVLLGLSVPESLWAVSEAPKAVFDIAVKGERN